MEYEFDPTLTQGAQNRYAEGMAEGNSEQNQKTAEEADAEAAKAELEKTAKNKAEIDARGQTNDTPQKVSQDATFIGKKLEELAKTLAAENAVNWEKFSQHLPDDIARSLQKFSRQQERAINPQSALEEATERISNDKADERQIRDASNYFKNIAQELIGIGETDAKIERLANATEDIPVERLRQMVKDMIDRDEFEDQLQKLVPPKAISLPGQMVEGDDDADLLNTYYPPSLDDVGERAEQVVGKDFKTGGKFEIMHKNEDGTTTLKPENLLHWMRKQWLVWGHQFSPDNPQVDPFGTIQILSYTGGISLGQMVTNERYWQKRVPKRNERGELIYQKDRYGRNKIAYDYVEDKGYNDLREYMIMEFWLWGKAHAYDAIVRPLKTQDKPMHDKVQEVLKENAWLQGQDRLLLTWKMPATSGTEGEYDWMGKGKGAPIEEGRAGRALRQADALYFRLGHIENMNDKENVFFDLLGDDGKREFFRSMIKRGLENMYKERAASILKIVNYRGEGTDRSTDVELQNVDLAEILFRKNTEQMKELFTGGINASKRANLENLLAKGGLTLDDFVGQAMSVRESILEDLTGWDAKERKSDKEGVVGFKDWKRVRDLFENANSDTITSNAAMEELGLRFIDTKLETPQGNKWGKDPGAARKAVRKELNLFNQGTKPKPFEKALRYAIQDAIGKVNNLDEDDAEYAENLAFAKVYWTFTSGFNDTTATGFDGSTKTNHMMGYRENNFDGGKNFVGNIQNLYGIKRTIIPFWMAMYGYVDQPDGSKQKKSLLSVMEHGLRKGSRPPKGTKQNTLQSINFDRTIETTYAGNHVAKGWALYERHIKGAIFELAKSMKVDNFGRVQTSPEAIKEIMSSVNNEIRYAFNQMQFDFEDEIDTIEIKWERNADGRMEAKPQFVREKMKDVFFDREIVNMGMYERRMFQDNWVNKRVGMKDMKGEDMLTEYSRNVLAWLLAKEILEHRLYNSSDSSYNYDIWELDVIRAIEGLFANIPMGGFDVKQIGLYNDNKKLRKRDSFFNRKEFQKIRKMGNATYGELWKEALRAQLAESAWKGSIGSGNKFFGYIFQDMWSFK